MQLKVCTPQKLILDESVDSVTLPGIEGQMTLLPKHAALLSQLGTGNVYYRKGERKIEGFTLSGGFVEVQGDIVLVMTRDWKTSAANP